MKILKSEAGFTLIELVLIIIVLGILAAVAINQFGTITADARNGALQGAVGPYLAQVAIAVNNIRGLPAAGGGSAAGSDDGCSAGANGSGEDCIYFDVVHSGTGITRSSYSGSDSWALCTGPNACGTPGDLASNGAAAPALAGGACVAPDRYIVLDYQSGTGAIFVSLTGACP